MSSLDPAIASRLKRDADGLVPAVVQDAESRDVLMVGWMDDEALHRTLTTGRGTFWSRSRQDYWVKGETSGNTQAVREVRLDCDGDTLAGDRRPDRSGLSYRRSHLLRRGPVVVTPRRLYAPVVLGTLAAGGLAFFALGRTWASSNVVADGLSTDTVSATGSDAHPLASALALVIVASALAILAASKRIRRAVGVLTVLVALVGDLDHRARAATRWTTP